jgi:hypothetical protein
MSEIKDMSIVPGYVYTKTGPNQFKVLKIDFTKDPVSVESRHEVKQGICDCTGFKYNLKCKHVQMVLGSTALCDRATARKAGNAIITILQDIENFDRVLFDCYEFADAEEEEVKAVKLSLKGRPIKFDDIEFNQIRGIVDGCLVIATIES